MPDNRLWSLIGRQLSGEASADEIKELQALLQKNPDKQYLWEMLQSYFNSFPSQISDIEAEDTRFEARFREILSADAPARHKLFDPIPDLVDHKKPVGFKKFRYYAAAFAGIAVMGWLAYNMAQPVQPAENKLLKASEVVAKPGARTKLVLPDGSQVWLNSGSKLNYQNDFNTGFREVELEGEAFFEVVKDTKHPFIVHVSSINIKVLGTSFAVKSYPQDETVEATLLKGMIEVTRKDNPNAPKVILKPNEKLIFHIQSENRARLEISARPKGSPSSSVSPDISVIPVSRNIPDSEKVETSWLYNRLVFNGDSFLELAEKMERWYNVRISFKNDALLRYRFKGAFANETVRDALNALQLTVIFTYQIKGNEIEIDKK